MEYIEIGNVKIEKTAALAPMAGVADTAFRLMAKKYGAALVYGEMVSSKGLVYSDRKSAELLTVTENEMPMAVQLFGSEPDFMEKAAAIAASYKPQLIDINCGCPVPKVVNTGAGSALMKNPELIGKLVRAVKNATDIPVTVKIRKGWDEDSLNAVEVAKIAEKEGVAAIAVHARTKAQMYSGKADLDIIKKVKEAVSVPVIGNGDVTDATSAKRMYDETGCNLVMLGRGAYGRPFVFRQIRHFFETGEILPEPCLEERLEIMREHIELIVRLKGENGGMREARKHAIWYLYGTKNAAKYRNACSELSTLSDFHKMIQAILDDNK